MGRDHGAHVVRDTFRATFQGETIRPKAGSGSTATATAPSPSPHECKGRLLCAVCCVLCVCVPGAAQFPN